MSVAQLPFLTASDRPEQPDQTVALDGARSNELETPVISYSSFVTFGNFDEAGEYQLRGNGSCFFCKRPKD